MNKFTLIFTNFFSFALCFDSSALSISFGKNTNCTNYFDNKTQMFETQVFEVKQGQNDLLIDNMASTLASKYSLIDVSIIANSIVASQGKEKATQFFNLVGMLNKISGITFVLTDQEKSLLSDAFFGFVNSTDVSSCIFHVGGPNYSGSKETVEYVDLKVITPEVVNQEEVKQAWNTLFNLLEKISYADCAKLIKPLFSADSSARFNVTNTLFLTRTPSSQRSETRRAIAREQKEEQQYCFALVKEERDRLVFEFKQSDELINQVLHFESTLVPQNYDFLSCDFKAVKERFLALASKLPDKGEPNPASLGSDDAIAVHCIQYGVFLIKNLNYAGVIMVDPLHYFLEDVSLFK